MFAGLFTDAFVISPYLESAQSSLVWNIAAGPGTHYSPNILSELSFDDMKSRGLGLNLAYLNRLNDRLAFCAALDVLSTNIQSGSVQDSDYYENNRQNEFSRSYSKAEGGQQHGRFDVGFKYRWFGNRGHYVSVLGGIQRFDQDIDISEGVQFIPQEQRGAPLSGLNSSYDSRFDSHFIALISEHAFSWGTLGIRYEMHNVEFDASANWNLRENFAHPTSFAHTAEGTGTLLLMGYSYAIADHWDLYTYLSRRSFEVSDGYDHTFLNDGSAVVLRLNEVELDIETVNAGARYWF